MNDNNFYSSYNDNENTRTKTHTLAISETTTAFAKAYLWMFVGALITFAVGLFSTEVLAASIITGNAAALSTFLIVSIVSTIVQFILCFTINKNALTEARYGKALAGFLVFSILNGISFSGIFLYFDVSVLFYTFGFVTLYFLILSGLTYLLRNKIQRATGFAYVGLITLLIASIIVSIYSLFFFTATSTIGVGLFLGLNIFGLIVFTVLTLVDIRGMYNVIDYSANKNCASIAAAFSLYLDFINIFVYILRILLILGRNVSRND